MPNLAIATALKKNQSSIQLLYVGSKSALDKRLVEGAHLPFTSIFTGKLRRYFSWRHFVDPFLVVLGFFQSLFIIIKFWPHAVFSKGGYVSLPVALAAFVLRRPIILHESDSRMGLANRILSHLSTKICVSFPDVMKQSPKVIFTGNPVRTEMLKGHPHVGYKLTGFRASKQVLLVWGGSQGAQQINDLIVREFHELKSMFQIVHITGKGKKTDLRDPSYVQFEYLEDELKHIYAITDLVFGRAGANSLYELALVKRPNVLLPLGNADQLNNARYFEQQGGSIILQKDQSLSELLRALWHNSQQRDLMKEALSRLSRPNATEEIAELILSI